MSRFDTLPGRALELATQVGEGIKNNVPDRAIKWIETGAALGALKTGTRLATQMARRNPVLTVAAAAGAGLLWYAARRKASQDANGGVIEGRSTRVEAKRAAPRKTASKRAGSTRSRSTSSSASSE